MSPGRLMLVLADATGVVFMAWSAALLFRRPDPGVHAVAPTTPERRA